MEIKTGIYTKKIEGILYEYNILKVMPKTISVELRTYRFGKPIGVVWFYYRFPKERINLCGYQYKKFEANN